MAQQQGPEDANTKPASLELAQLSEDEFDLEFLQTTGESALIVVKQTPPAVGAVCTSLPHALNGRQTFPRALLAIAPSALHDCYVSPFAHSQ